MSPRHNLESVAVAAAAGPVLEEPRKPEGPRHNLEAVAEALYGKRWHVELAADMGVSTREVRRWHKDPSMIMPHMRHRIRMVAERRLELVGKAFKALGLGTALDAKTIARNFDMPESPWIAIKRNPQLAIQIELNPKPKIAPMTDRDFEAAKAKVASTAAKVAAYQASRVPTPEPVPNSVIVAATEDVSAVVEQKALQSAVSVVEDKNAVAATTEGGQRTVRLRWWRRGFVSLALPATVASADVAAPVIEQKVVDLPRPQPKRPTLPERQIATVDNIATYLWDASSIHHGVKSQQALYDADFAADMARYEKDLARFEEVEAYARAKAPTVEPEPPVVTPTEGTISRMSPATAATIREYYVRGAARQRVMSSIGIDDLMVGDEIGVGTRAWIGGMKQARVVRIEGPDVYIRIAFGKKWLKESLLDREKFCGFRNREDLEKMVDALIAEDTAKTAAESDEAAHRPITAAEINNPKSEDDDA